MPFATFPAPFVSQKSLPLTAYQTNRSTGLVIMRSAGQDGQSAHRKSSDSSGQADLTQEYQ
jgi:hypothetical protein